MSSLVQAVPPGTFRAAPASSSPPDHVNFLPAFLRPSGIPSACRRDQTADSVRPVRAATSLAGSALTSASSSAVQGRPALGGRAPRRRWASLIFRRVSALGTAPFSAGVDGAGLGVAGGTMVTVLDLLRATDAQAVNGVLDGGDRRLRHQTRERGGDAGGVSHRPQGLALPHVSRRWKDNHASPRVVREPSARMGCRGPSALGQAFSARIAR
jgi:hypothetical protein